MTKYILWYQSCQKKKPKIFELQQLNLVILITYRLNTIVFRRRPNCVRDRIIFQKKLLFSGSFHARRDKGRFWQKLVKYIIVMMLNLLRTKAVSKTEAI